MNNHPTYFEPLPNDLIPDKLEKKLNFTLEIDKMKNILRQNLLVDGSRRETDAEHSWHLAMTAWVLYDHCALEGTDLNRILKMALIHDLVEIYAGDTFAYDKKGYTTKENREDNSADKLFSMLPDGLGKEYHDLWIEFDDMKTPDAIYAAAIDRLLPFMANLETQGHTWKLHNVAKKDVYARMSPVKTALPSLYPFVEYTIEKSFNEGYLT
ncbi:MAG: HD domain-containing protein [Ruminococcaceae bacterium]|nr:HD domain-containing protein [Oscillospiraceae bacterium]